MKTVILLLTFFSFSTWGRTYDLSNRFGVGGGAGYTFPIQGNDFDDFADSELMWELHARYNFTPSDGLLFNYSLLEFENTDISAQVIDVMYLNRINESDKFTPILGIGAGVADLENVGPFDDDLKFSARARAGFEYSLTDDLVASIYADYLFVGKMPSNSENEDTRDESFPGREIFALIPQVNLTFFFGPDTQM
jgi:hypothetical protein